MSQYEHNEVTDKLISINIQSQVLSVFQRNPQTHLIVITTNTFRGTWYLPHSQVHNDRTVPLKISAIRTLDKRYIAYFSLRIHNTQPYFYFRSKV